MCNFCYQCGGLLESAGRPDPYGTYLHSDCLEELEENWDEHDAYARSLRKILDKEKAERARIRAQ